MIDSPPPTPLPDKDYEIIEQAVMETARGRWFLSEFARRNRSADTRVLLEAISRLESVVKREREIDDVDRLRVELTAMKRAIEKTKQEIAEMQVECGDNDQLTEATAELDAIVEQTETATGDILNRAEAVQEIAWTLREAGADPEQCDALDNNATEIYTACSFQDLTGQRTRKVVDVLGFLESHINRMIDIWGDEEIEVEETRRPRDERPDAHLLNGPQRSGRGHDQDAIDNLFDSEVHPDAGPMVDVEVDWNDADAFEAVSVDAESPSSGEEDVLDAEFAEADSSETDSGTPAQAAEDDAPADADDPFATADDPFAEAEDVVAGAAEVDLDALVDVETEGESAPEAAEAEAGETASDEADADAFLAAETADAEPAEDDPFAAIEEPETAEDDIFAETPQDAPHADEGEETGSAEDETRAAAPAPTEETAEEAADDASEEDAEGAGDVGTLADVDIGDIFAEDDSEDEPEEPRAAGGTLRGAAASATSEPAGLRSADDPTAHLTMGERLALFS
ncbi:protein phosphatase CheZ [Rhodobium gokarnense]|uniref:Chemotaxis regulatin CheY-phosphate phosphatase CheZ n=1 Tax=Rhodobium gokarnense TaxID=364296 RepID=A0ABT3HIM4_9HYPH|nr:protein phosphatase CheZ [Rhodobium gokarnense]MCW2310253.1 chemotaxis regulatin CheY-phosphate phosphatase CheZ [Rhodobium gokarnense]